MYVYRVSVNSKSHHGFISLEQLIGGTGDTISKVDPTVLVEEVQDFCDHQVSYAPFPWFSRINKLNPEI